MHDELTGLFDRRQFFKILHKQVRICNDLRTPAGLLVVEIQRFRKINSTYGYSAGDEVLQQVAELLKQVQRRGDYLARIGSDSFALLLSRIANPGHAELAAFKIQQLLDLPVLLQTDNLARHAPGDVHFAGQTLSLETVLQYFIESVNTRPLRRLIIVSRHSLHKLSREIDYSVR